MRSYKPIIPAALVNSVQEFTDHLEFAKKVGNSIHVDVIDTDFVNGEGLAVNKWPELNIEYAEAHLMVRKPLDYLEAIKAKGATRAIVHVESSFELAELAKRCRELDLLLGFAVNLDTDLAVLKPFFDISNYIQVMGIVPGATGRRQDPQAALAVSYLRTVPNQRLIISVDGGVNENNILGLKRAGANYFVASSAIFDGSDWFSNYQHMLELVENIQTTVSPSQDSSKEKPVGNFQPSN